MEVSNQDFIYFELFCLFYWEFVNCKWWIFQQTMELITGTSDGYTGIMFTEAIGRYLVVVNDH